jgi:hypothetical protein
MTGAESTVVDTITNLERLNNSVNGNPRWRVLLANAGPKTTAPDAQVGHVIENSEYREGQVSVTLNPEGQIIRVKTLEKNA